MYTCTFNSMSTKNKHPVWIKANNGDQWRRIINVKRFIYK